MGVKGLTGLLQRLAPDSVRARHITHYSGKTLAVDVSCYLNRFIYGLDPHPARVQRGVHRLCLYLELHGIKPIFVFDAQDRIIEKQREGLRRDVLKEKVQKSFELEIKRNKQRLGSLREPAKILQTLSDDQMMNVLRDIRTRGTSTVSLSTSAAAPAVVMEKELEVDEIESAKEMLYGGRKQKKRPKTPDEQSPSKDCATFRPLSALEPLDDLSLLLDGDGDDNVEGEWSWELGKLTDQEFASLKREQSPLTIDFTDQVNDNDDDENYLEQELDTLDRLELEFDSVKDLDLVWPRRARGQGQDEDNDDPVGSLSLQQAIRTGTSIEHLIPAAELALLKLGNPESPEFDERVQKSVHKALKRFLHSMESDSGQDILLDQSQNRRQRELSELEQQLVRKIKKATQADHEREQSLNAGSEIKAQEAKGDACQEKQDDRVGLGTMTSPAGQLEIIDSSAAVPQNVVANEETNQTNVSTEAAGVWTATGEEDESTVATTPDIEPEEDRDLRTTIKSVVSAHQNILMTLERRAMKVARPLVVECENLLRAMGRPVIEAEEAEAEAVCAQLTTLGWADGSVSEDTDTVVFGDGILLRQVLFGNTGKDILEIDPVAARAALGLNRQAFIDMCILCGTDFSGKMEGIASFRAANLIQYYGSIESIMANTQYKPEADFFYDHARRVFDRKPAVPLDPQTYQRRKEQTKKVQKLFRRYEIDEDEIRAELIKEMQALAAVPPQSSNLNPTGLGVDPFDFNPFGASLSSMPIQNGNEILRQF
ncbi:Elongation of fatty acids protein 2 [Gryganskiella cystojenkinii]|nr:Elongation of fatty acids protein 2 [Gryganskiella cystojenkinii]